MDKIANQKPEASSPIGTPQAENGEPENTVVQASPTAEEGLKPHPPDRKKPISTTIGFLPVRAIVAVLGWVGSIIYSFTKPSSAKAYFNRGLEYYHPGDLDRAISDFGQAILLNPDYAEAYKQRGLAYFSKDDLEHAISDFDKAIRLNPEYVEAYCIRGLAYAKKGDIERAIGDLNKAIQIKPDNAEAYCDRGYVYISKDETQNAIIDFNKVLELCDTDSESYEYAVHMIYELEGKQKT